MKLFFISFAVCESNGLYQYNEKVICEDWFDYTNPCSAPTCDGNTRMSLTSDTISWMNSQGLTATSSVFCQQRAPWPIYGSNAIQVELVCQQICDTCPPTTTTTTTTTTSPTTTENTSKDL